MTFFDKVKSFFAKVFKNAPGWEKAASATLTIVAPLLETVIALTAGEPAAALVAGIIGEVQSDMGAASALISGAGNPATLSSVLNSINSNLSGVLTAGHIKDPATLSKVTATVNTIIGETNAIAKELPA